MDRSEWKGLINVEQKCYDSTIQNEKWREVSYSNSTKKFNPESIKKKEKSVQQILIISLKPKKKKK